MTEQTALVTHQEEPELSPYEVMERVISTGDLNRMTPQDRVAFYWRTCESLGLNPLTRPFGFIKDRDGAIVMYAKKDATDQLRELRGVSVTKLERELDTDELYTVTAHGRMPDGREDEATGVVNLRGISGEARANAKMKAETKAKRRLTLSLVGLGFLDESETDGLEKVEVGTNGDIQERERPSLLAQVQGATERLAEPPAQIEPEPVQVAEPEPVEVKPKREPKVKPSAAIVEPQAPEPASTSGASGLTLIEFSARLADSGLDRAKVRERVKELYPEAGRFGDLTPEQLLNVWIAITPEPTTEPVEGEVTELPDDLFQPMPVEVSAATSAVCGDQSPFSDSVCLELANHTGPHSAGKNESW